MVVLIIFILLVLALLFGFIYHVTDIDILGYISAISLISFMVLSIWFVIYDEYFIPTSEQYERIINKINRDKLELEPFIIGHPEFRDK